MQSSVRVLTNYLNSPQLTPIKNILFVYFAYRVLARSSQLLLRAFWTPRILYEEVESSLKKVATLRSTNMVAVLKGLFRLLRKIPLVKRKIEQELSKTIGQMEHTIAAPIPGIPRYLTLPDRGISEAELTGYLKYLHTFNDKVSWKTGRVSGAIYHGGEDLSRIISQAFSLFILSNPLHPELFPGVRKMEAETVSMVLGMFHAPPEGVGCLTSGGTESILVACKAYRDMARDLKGITKPEMFVH